MLIPSWFYLYKKIFSIGILFVHLAWNLIQESISILWLEKSWKNMQNGLHDKDIKHLFIEIGKCGHKILSVMPSLDDVVLSRNWYDSKLSCIKLVEWFTFSWKWGRQQFKFMIYNTRSYEKIHWIHLIETFLHFDILPWTVLIQS